ncbi:hypothetical protein ACRE_050270 [Hapsidospora chrysogenum ATCC 11550]|uniref:Uncharacterized protein n=1 Tax=Hapsidospora chrysogenum (strain ATCC 11550 / CBS 779.69 / DSM 880 / IAM 14645 / JCM 23072 / IMI 49137) TaxID=857340 RepID=A0A086T476_HAPC1|nr:hypothetical protein ACRE_050270 [Hapsidospora chrysogenum ATCC 11550]
MDGSGIETDTPPRNEPCRRLLYAMDRCAERVDPRPGVKWQGESFVLHLARFLAGSEVWIDSDLLERYIGTGRQGLGVPEHPAGEPKAQLRQCYSQTLHLVCTIAQGRTQGRTQGRDLQVQCSGHTSLLAICHKLGHLPLPRWFLQGLIRDGAILLAQQMKDPRNVAFVECQQTQSVASPGGLGWHWEEGIGEWVMRSPGSKKGTAVDVKHRGAAAAAGETAGPVQPQTRRHPHQTDPDQHDKGNDGITAPEGDSRRRTSACGPVSVGDGPVPHPSPGKAPSNPEGKRATASGEEHGKVDEHDDLHDGQHHATSLGVALDPDPTVSVGVHGHHQRHVEGSKSKGRSKSCADAAEGGKGKMMRARAGPQIGKRRKLLIVRGIAGSQRPVHDAHWSDW